MVRGHLQLLAVGVGRPGFIIGRCFGIGARMRSSGRSARSAKAFVSFRLLRTLAQVGWILVSGNDDLLGKRGNIRELVTGTPEQGFN
jgi:hypothetical protein